ncbi:MAG: hypothetical protein AAF682_01685 [Planctomycetota bacterium]
MRWIPSSVLALLAFVPLAVGASSPAPAAAVWEDPVEIDILTLVSVDWQQGKELPDKIKRLDGRKVVISGYMQSQFRNATDTFMLVADSCQCTGTPLPNHFVRIKLPQKTDFKPGELSFIGTLSVGEEMKDGFVDSLYRLDGDFL